MRQLQLFSTAELARMRARTASRSYSPEAEEFRRNHERHRAWGLVRRHAERMRRLREAHLAALAPGPIAAPVGAAAVVAAPAPATARARAAAPGPASARAAAPAPAPAPAP